MPLIDYTSPGFVITVIANQPEIRVQGRPDARTLGQVLDRMTDVTERVISFEYEDAEREQDVLKLRVDNHDLYFFDHPAWVKGNLVRFFFGYPGRIFGPRYAIVDNMRGFTTLDITCVVESAMSNEAKNRIFKSMTRTDVIVQLVGEGVFSGVNNIDIDETGIKGEKARDWQQARQSDWQFLQKLAEDPGYEVYIEDDTLHFHPRRLSRAPSRKYEYFYGTGDLLDFNLEEYRVTDRAGEVEVAGRDPLARENFKPTGNNANTKRDTLGGQGSTVIKRQNRTGDLVSGKRILPTPERDKATAKNQADAAFKVGEQGEVKASATIIGDPLLAAKQIVEVVGISKALSGNFYVMKHTHKIDSGGYKGSLSLIKNAVEVLPTTSPPTLDPAKAKDNRQEAPTDRRLIIVRDPRTGNLVQRKR